MHLHSSKNEVGKKCKQTPYVDPEILPSLAIVSGSSAGDAVEAAHLAAKPICNASTASQHYTSSAKLALFAFFPSGGASLTTFGGCSGFSSMTLRMELRPAADVTELRPIEALAPKPPRPPKPLGTTGVASDHKRVQFNLRVSPWLCFLASLLPVLVPFAVLPPDPMATPP